MESLILPLVIFLLVGLWGVYETGRKFRKEFRKRGKTWPSLCADMAAGQGTLIVDTLWGPQRGLGHPVIWYSPQSLVQGQELEEELVQNVFLIRPPRSLRTPEALREKFGSDRIIVHTWSIDLSFIQNAERV